MNFHPHVISRGFFGWKLLVLNSKALFKKTRQSVRRVITFECDFMKDSSLMCYLYFNLLDRFCQARKKKPDNIFSSLQKQPLLQEDLGSKKFYLNTQFSRYGNNFTFFVFFFF